MYYSQVFWAYDIRQENGVTEYLLTEKWGAEPIRIGLMLLPRPITASEIEPIHPDAGDKLIRVNMSIRRFPAWKADGKCIFARFRP